MKKKIKLDSGATFTGKILTNPEHTGHKPADETPLASNQGVVDQYGIRYHIDPNTPGRNFGAGDGVMTFFQPRNQHSSSGMLTLTNQTFADLMQNWRGQIRRHQERMARAHEGMRYDPVTKTYY